MLQEHPVGDENSYQHSSLTKRESAVLELYQNACHEAPHKRMAAKILLGSAVSPNKCPSQPKKSSNRSDKNRSNGSVLKVGYEN